MFTGFPSGCQSFFADLADNNNREWFAENKDRYESLVMQPALEFVSEMQRPLTKLSPFFTAIPKRSGGSLMRIYRDIRFSREKIPFKTNLGIHFRHEAGINAHAPGFYFHIDAESALMGCGIWQPDRPVLESIRFLIDDDGQRWRRIRNKLLSKGLFELEGSSLKKCPKGYEENHPLIEDLKRKDHFVSCRLTLAEICTPELVNTFISRAKMTMPYMRFLCDSIQLPC